MGIQDLQKLFEINQQIKQIDEKNYYNFKIKISISNLGKNLNLFSQNPSLVNSNVLVLWMYFLRQILSHLFLILLTDWCSW